MKANISFISLGCDKNLVDSEVMLGLTKKAGFNIVPDEADADIIVINTCCFIKDALEESIETIIDAGKYKEDRCKGIIIAGCLGQRYEKEIFEEMPEVDAVIGTTAYEDIVEVAERVLNGEKKFKDIKSIDFACDDDKSELRVLSSAGYSANLKIAEGCNNHCTYCVIPKLRGKYRSRKMESLVREAEMLAKNGVKELVLVAQDVALYGIDLYGENRLHILLEKLCEIEGIEWIRLLYCYPEHLTDETIAVMAKEEKICKYIDMPLQHTVDTVLKKMGRRSTKAMIREIVNKLRTAMPDIAIRTTIITGFPQETEENVNELIDFISEIKFDRLGVFSYSQEEGTPAAKMEGQIDDDVKEERRNRILECQKFISAEKCESMVGKVIKVIIDGKIPEENIYCGRCYKDAPDIDGMVFIRSDYELLSGDFADVLITEASDYDLIGETYYGDESAE